MMRNKKLFYGILAVVIAILGIGLFVYLIKPTITPLPEGKIVVKQSGGAGILIHKCADRNYITNTADYIIEGTVEKVESKWNGEKTLIFTYSDLRIEKYIKGILVTKDKLQIITPGGTVEEISQWVEDQPIFHEGKKVRIYLKKTDGEFSIVCAQFGVEEINEPRIIGEGCSIDSDCMLPPEPYGLSSYGPYDAKCINNRCKVIVNLLTKCNLDSECDCSSYNPPNLPKEYDACSCINQSCTVIIE